MTTTTPTSVTANSKTSGQHGELRLELEKRGGKRTSLTRRYFTVPFGPTWAIYPPGAEDIPELFITNPAGGILGGDRYEIDVALGPGAAATVLTTGATKIYRGPESVQNALFRLNENAFLEYLPHHAIPFAGSSYRQTNTFYISEDATLVCWEAYSAGRVGRDERFAFSALANRTRIFREGVTNGVPEVVDGFELSGGGEPFGGYPYAATVYACGPHGYESLAERLHSFFFGLPAVLASSSAPAPGVCVTRVLARNAPFLYQALNGCRDVIRGHLGLPEPSRKVV